jgi:hypothetical protein
MTPGFCKMWIVSGASSRAPDSCSQFSEKMRPTSSLRVLTPRSSFVSLPSEPQRLTFLTEQLIRKKSRQKKRSPKINVSIGWEASDEVVTCLAKNTLFATRAYPKVSSQTPGEQKLLGANKLISLLIELWILWRFTLSMSAHLDTVSNSRNPVSLSSVCRSLLGGVKSMQIAVLYSQLYILRTFNSISLVIFLSNETNIEQPVQDKVWNCPRRWACNFKVISWTSSYKYCKCVWTIAQGREVGKIYLWTPITRHNNSLEKAFIFVSIHSMGSPVGNFQSNVQNRYSGG